MRPLSRLAPFCLCWGWASALAGPLPGLHGGSVVELRQVGSRGADELRLSLPLAGESVTLLLTPFSLRQPGFRLLQLGAAGARELEPAPISTFRGRLAGRPASRVHATWTARGLQALLQDGADTWYIEPSGAGAHVVYQAADLDPLEATCGVEAGQRLANRLEGLAPPGASAPPGLALAQLIADTDPEFVAAHDSPAAAQEDIETVLNLVSAQYIRELGIDYRLTATILREPSSPNPYHSTSASGLLSEMTAYWKATPPTAQPRDLIHLFTGKNLDGSTIGLAWVGTICKPSNVGLSQSLFSALLANRVDLTAHELGHAWNAKHCNEGDPNDPNYFSACCALPSYTMCSYLGAQVRGEFAPSSRSVILALRDKLLRASPSCLDLEPTPPPPPASAPGGLGWSFGLSLLLLALGYRPVSQLQKPPPASSAPSAVARA